MRSPDCFLNGSNMNQTTPPTALSYRDAGVDIAAGNRLVDVIKPSVRRTHRPGVIGGLGGFGGMFELPEGQWRQPIFVSGTDGVGTKLRLAIDLNNPDTVGIDLVAMCVNDIVVTGAEPLWFLDYFATGKLDVDHAARVIQGIAKGCELAGAALLGGETAEMPGMYQAGDFDLAGFAVGVVDKPKVIEPSKIQVGDAIIGIASSGPHSNGYSLIRKILQRDSAQTPFAQTTLGETLLTPTRIYVKPLLDVIANHSVHGMAHITGGGLFENIPRCLPNGCKAVLSESAWQQPDIFDWIQRTGNVNADDMWLTFNCGLGMVVVVPQDEANAVVNRLQVNGETATVVGEIAATENSDDAPFVQREN